MLRPSRSPTVCLRVRDRRSLVRIPRDAEREIRKAPASCGRCSAIVSALRQACASSVGLPRRRRSTGRSGSVLTRIASKATVGRPYRSRSTRSRTSYRRAVCAHTEHSNHPSDSSPRGVPQQSVDLDAGEGFGLGAHAPAQGSTISIPMSSKSRTLRVASLMRRAAAMAAIWQSAEATGRPAERRAAAMWP